MCGRRGAKIGLAYNTRSREEVDSVLAQAMCTLRPPSGPCAPVHFRKPVGSDAVLVEDRSKAWARVLSICRAVLLL
jgi:hypothetical protein